jgi:hypothetical protein
MLAENCTSTESAPIRRPVGRAFVVPRGFDDETGLAIVAVAGDRALLSRVGRLDRRDGIGLWCVPSRRTPAHVERWAHLPRCDATRRHGVDASCFWSEEDVDSVTDQ